MRCLLAEVVPLASGVESWGLLLGIGLLRDECLYPQLDVSSTAWDRRFLTSIVMLPSYFRGEFMRTGYHDSGDLAKMQYLLVWLLHWR